jgi:outer membrane protein assembly factor BamA
LRTTNHSSLLKKHFFILFLVFCVEVDAQVSTIPYKDLMDLFTSHAEKNKLKQEKEKKLNLSVMPAAGYAMHTGWAGILTANLALHSSGDTTIQHKLSSIATNITYTAFKQVMLPIQANIWSRNDKLNYQIDYRFIKYPSKVFGLEDDAGVSEGYFVKYSGLKLHQTVMGSIGKNLYAGLGLYYDLLWNIHEVDPPANVKTAFQQYGISERVQAAGPALKLIYDSRMNAINPTSGLLASMAYRNNVKWLGTDAAWESIQFDFRKYVKFPSNSNNTLAFWNLNWFTLKGKPPFLLLPSTGWDDTYNSGRGYIQGRYRGRNMIYLESEYRFQISKNGLVGGTFFVNGQSFSHNIFNAYDAFKIGYGVGLRLKVNKHSGANICIDYGFGKNGSRGFAVNLGEVF